MVYDRPPPTQSTFASSTQDDKRHDISLEIEESGDEDRIVEDAVDPRDPQSASPIESQIVVRRSRRGKRRVLEESFGSPEATDSVNHPKKSEHQAKVSECEIRPIWRASCVEEVKSTEKILSIPSNESGNIATDDAIFKRPGKTAPMRRPNETTKCLNAYTGESENIDDILEAFNASDDESLLIELSAFEQNTSGKMEETGNTSEACSSRTRAAISVDSSKSKRTRRSTENGNSNYKPLSLCKTENLSRSLLLKSNKSCFDATTLDSLQQSGNLSTKDTQCGRTRFVRELNKSNVYSKSNIELKSEQSLNTGSHMTNVDQNSNITLVNSKSDICTSFDDCKNLSYSKSRITNAKTNETAAASRTVNEPKSTSPIFPPLTTTTSSKSNSSYTHAHLEKITDQAYGESGLDTSKAFLDITSKAPSPALTVCGYFFPSILVSCHVTFMPCDHHMPAS